MSADHPPPARKPAIVAPMMRHFVVADAVRSCYVYAADADALHAELRAKGANVVDEPVSHPWGLHQFHVLDLEGNQVRFGHTFE